MKRLLLFFFTIPAFCESLHYAINWPSGLSLGEATLEATHTGEKSSAQWTLWLSIDASIPGFAVRDDDKSTATAELCSIEFDKTFAHGQHRNQETLKFDQQTHQRRRKIGNIGGRLRARSSGVYPVSAPGIGGRPPAPSAAGGLRRRLRRARRI